MIHHLLPISWARWIISGRSSWWWVGWTRWWVFGWGHTVLGWGWKICRWSRRISGTHGCVLWRRRAIARRCWAIAWRWGAVASRFFSSRLLIVIASAFEGMFHANFPLVFIDSAIIVHGDRISDFSANTGTCLEDVQLQNNDDFFALNVVTLVLVQANDAKFFKDIIGDY